ncbi:hypothetical protein BC833DRAFT_571083 [Globomyces pollinis-pini]|nr:hypothetical protein BC833DRAFT_571083 [Globomyces pollinis-pini]
MSRNNQPPYNYQPSHPHVPPTPYNPSPYNQRPNNNPPPPPQRLPNYNTPLKTLAIDEQTLNRFKDLELNHVTTVSKFEQDVKDLNQQINDLQLALTTKDSLIKDLDAKKNHLSKLLEIQQSENIKNNSSDALKQLQSQLDYERNANIQMDAYLKELQANANHPDVNHLNELLNAEKTANLQLDALALSLKKELAELKAKQSLASPTTSSSFEALQRQLDKERAANAQQVKEKDTHIARLIEQIKEQDKASVVSSNSDRYMREISDLKRANASHQQQVWNLTEQLKRANEALKQNQSSSVEPSKLFLRNTPSGTQPPSVAPKGFDPDLWKLFLEFDKLKTGRLDVGELHQTISKGPWPPLSLNSAWILVRIADGNGEFVVADKLPIIWAFLKSCKLTFEKFDKHRSSANVWGFVEENSLEDAFKALEIRLPKKALANILKKHPSPDRRYTWDEFVAVVSLVKVWLVEFDKIDLDRDRAISMLYDQYMITVSRCIQ